MPDEKKPKMTDDEFEAWKMLDESLADYDRKQKMVPPPKPTKAPSWANEDVDDNLIGSSLKKAKPVAAAPAAVVAPPVAPAGFGAASVLSAAEQRLEFAWKQVALGEQEKKRLKEEEEKKRQLEAKRARELARQEAAMEREVELAQQAAEESQRKRLKKMQKHREKAEQEIAKKNQERLKAAEEELRRRTVLDKREKRKRRDDDKKDWDEQEVLMGYKGEEAAKEALEAKKSLEEKERAEVEEAKKIKNELKNLKFYSPAAAKKLEEESKEKLEKADAILKKREENLARLRAKQDLRKLREEINAEEIAKTRKDNQEKQKRMVAEQLAIAQAQQKATEDAEMAAEESGNWEALARDAATPAAAPAAAAPAAAAPAAKAPAAAKAEKPKPKEAAWPPPGARQLIADPQRIKGFFKALPTLPACTDMQAGRCGQHCIIVEERPIGETRLGKLRFEDGFVSWYPMLCVAGECWYEQPALWVCDVCGTVCCPAATLQPRVCGDIKAVRELYDAHFRTGVLPQWNPRNVPNPRRAACAGQECEIDEEDTLNGKVRLKFEDNFLSWFPRLVLQGAKTQAAKAAAAKGEPPPNTDPRGFGSGTPPTLPPTTANVFQTGFKPAGKKDAA